MSECYNLSQIAEILGAKLRGGRLASAITQPRVSLLLTDSRSLTFADQTLFFALRTAKGDGHKYIPQLYQQGVRAFVVSNSVDSLSKICSEAWFLKVDDVLSALQTLAAYRRHQYKIPVVGITGSNGKTIVKEWLYQLLHDLRNIVRSPRSYNSQIGVPLSVWQLHEGCELGIFEAGISRPGEMSSLEPIILPDVGILTNIGTAHEENFESLNHKLIEKLRLFEHSDIIIYNADIPGISDAMEEIGIGARSMAWTMKHRDAQVEVLSVQRGEGLTTVRYIFLGLVGEFVIPMSDDASLENAMNCLCLMLYLGMDRDDIADRMFRLQPLAMRLEVVEGKQGCLLINDVYNSDITSLETALEFQKRRSSSSLKNTLIISDIQESGLTTEELCRRISGLAKLHDLYRFVGIGPILKSQSHLFENVARKSSFYLSTEEFMQSREMEKMVGELVLLKGARQFAFENISESLQLRRHETILEINLNAIVHNLNQYRSHLDSSTKVVCMVKAFGYGNGSYELAKTLQDAHVDYLAVAVADEGAELRRQGITTPIIVMNPEMSAFRTIVEYKLEPEIYSFRLLDAFIHEIVRYGVTHYPVHVKIDSGMHRLGFMPEEMDALVERLSDQSTVCVRSVFSHLAGADSEAFDTFTQEQVRRFTWCADLLSSVSSHKILRHILNSAGIERFPQYQMDMCRLGIGLYGFEASSHKMDLMSVSQLKSSILQIKNIPQEETIGYSRKGVLSRPSRIAMVPIGYADGYDRRLGNGRAAMLVGGKRCPTIGNVCMDVTFIDVTDHEEIREGDEVVIFGHGLPLTELSETLETIPYEVISTISTRVKRIYYKE